MSDALKQAKKGRITILKEMDKEINKPNKKMNEHAPKMEMITVHKDKIREVIGSGGKVIREIVEVSGAMVDIDDEGVIKIASSDQNSIDEAKKMIHDIVDEPENGKVYNGKVVKVVDFGAFVNFMGKKDGLVHISALTEERVDKVSDVLKANNISNFMIEIGGELRFEGHNNSQSWAFAIEDPSLIKAIHKKA